MKERAPAFQFYPRQFAGDDAVMAMDLDAIGAHILLMCAAAASPEQYRIRCRMDAGSMPEEYRTDTAERAIRTRLRNPSDEDWQRIKTQLLSGAWKVSDDGYWWEQDGLLRSFTKQRAFSEQQSERARQRWLKEHPESIPNESRADAEPLQEGMPEVCSSSASSSAKKEQRPSLGPDTQGTYAGSLDDHGVDVAFAFMETFQLSGIAIRQAVAEAIDLRMKLTNMPAIACCEQIISEYQAYVDSQLDSKFKKGEKTWLAECNKPAAKASSAQNPGPTPKNALNALERTRAGLCCVEGWEKRTPEEVRAELALKWPEMERRRKAACA